MGHSSRKTKSPEEAAEKYTQTSEFMSSHPRSYDARRSPRHALRVTNLVFVILLLCVEIGLYIPSPDPLALRHLLLALVLMGLTVALNWNIFPVAMVYMAVWSVITVLPTFNGNAFLTGFLFCIAVVIVNCTLRQMLWSFVVPAIAFTATFIAVQQQYGIIDVAGVKDELVVLALNIVVAALAGLVIRFAVQTQEGRAQAAELRLARSEADRLNRDILLAGQMHDNLTNDLTTILTLAYAHTHGPENDPSGDWKRVSQSADHALATAHNAIDVLRGHGENMASFACQSNVFSSFDPEISDEDNSDLCGVLEDAARKAAEELNDLGFPGSVNIDRASLPSSVDPAVHDEVVRLVREICANVRRHGSKDGDWSLRISADPEEKTLIIVGMNTVDGNRPVIGRSGRGLELHARTIARLGGRLTTHLDDGIWTIRAVIPYQKPGRTD